MPTPQRGPLVRTPALVGATIIAALLAVASSAEPPPPPPPPAPAPTEREAEPASTADSILSRAQSTADAALTWLRRRGGEASRDVADRAARAEDHLRRSLQDANARAAAMQPRGVRTLDGVDAGGKPVWAPLDDAAAELPARLVLLVHGIDEPGTIWDEMAPALAENGLRVARFDYANDGALADAADALAASLRDMHARGVRTVHIVAHSAGGLISRDVLTRPAHYAGDARGRAGLPDIDRLIMIGTPNAGSAFARVRFVLEIREQFVRWIDADGRDPAALLGFLHDGDGQAGQDLRPGSPYLADLSARPLPRNVAITTVVGTLGDTLAADAAAVLDWPLAQRLLSAQEIADARAALAGLGQSFGDGVVSIDSQTLPGVEDVVYVEANHRTMLRRIHIPGRAAADQNRPPAIDAVLERVRPGE